MIHNEVESKLTIDKLVKLMVFDSGFETYCKRQTGQVQYAAYKTQIKNLSQIEAALKLL